MSNARSRSARFDLHAEASALRAEPAFVEQGHTAKTLIKHPDLRVVLLVLGREGRFKEHRTDHGITVQAISGRIRLNLPDESFDLEPGQLLALEPSVPHDVEALVDSVALLSIGWSS